MTAIAVDFSDARPSAASLKAAGVSIVIRYLTGSGKAITKPELQEYLDNGIAVAFVFEVGANDAAGGFAAGAAHAQQALAALKALGVPDPTVPVYFAVDTSVAPASAVPYFQGVNSVLSMWRTGDYGEGALCQLLETDGLSKWHWQSESTSFPGNATTLSITHLQQRFNASPVPGTDLDVICKADVGQFPRPVGPKPAPIPPAPPSPEENDTVTSIVTTNDGKTQLHVFGTIGTENVHWYQDFGPGATDTSWHVEKLPAAS